MNSTTMDTATEQVDEEVLPPPARPGMFRRLFSSTLHYGIGQSLPQVIRFLLIPVYTRFLTPDDYGILELAGVLGVFLTILMRFGVPGAVSRFYFDHPEGPALRNYITTIAWFLVGSSTAIAAATFLFGPWLLTRYLPDLPFYPYAAITVFSAMISCNQNLQDRLVQAREQAAYAARLNIGRAAVSILLAILFVVVFRWGALGMLLAELAGAGLFFLQAFRYLRPELRGHFETPLIRPSLAYSMGVLPSHFMGSVAPLITRSFLANVDSLAAVGLLGFATRFTQPLTILGFAFQNAFIPVYYSVRHDRTADGLNVLATTARNVWTGATGFAIMVAMLAPPAIDLITPEKFHSAGRLVPILSLGFLCQVLHTLFAVEIYYSKKTYLVPIVSAAAVATTVTLTILTARAYGETGIAWAMAAGQLATALVGGIIATRLVSIPYPWFDLMRVTAVAALVFAVGMAFGADRALTEILVAVGCIVAFPLTLLIAGDPSIRAIAQFFSSRLRARLI